MTDENKQQQGNTNNKSDTALVDKSTTTTTISTASSTTEQLVETFERDGYLVLKNAIPIISTATATPCPTTNHPLLEWQQFANTYFAKCFEILHDKGHTEFPTHKQLVLEEEEADHHKYALGLGIKHGFREIVMRSPGRYELSLLDLIDHTGNGSADGGEVSRHPLWSSLGGTALPSIQTIQQHLHSKIPPLLGATHWNELSLCHLSLLVSTPGAAEQSWHADGGHVNLQQHLPCHVANVFIPLQDLPLALGPTEFRPGSHVYTRNLAPLLLAAKCRKELRPTLTPTLSLGDVLVFDYRVLHRGKANTTASSVRNVLVLTYCQPFFKDVLNFPTRSMYDAPVADVAVDDNAE